MSRSGRFCPFCGTTNPPEYRFCGTCQHELPTGGGTPARDPRRRRRWAIGLGIAAVGVAVSLAALALVPISSNFALSVTSSLTSNPATTWQTFPSNAHVTFDWNTTDGGSVTFSLVAPDDAVLESSSGSHGSTSFVSAGGAYGFRSSSVLYEVVDVQGTYVAPLLA